jgi:hypothetical protein
MLLVDDLLVKPFVSVLDLLHTLALNELYDVSAIRDEMKENRLLFELGERSREEYERRRTELERELELAEEVRRQTSRRFEVKG